MKISTLQSRTFKIFNMKATTYGQLFSNLTYALKNLNVYKKFQLEYLSIFERCQFIHTQ